MKLSDKETLKQLKLVKSYELKEMLDEYPEEERDGRSDMQMLADETGYLISRYNEDDTGHYYDLVEAREILNEIRQGMPLDPLTLKPKYPDWKIQCCKDIIAEYRRLCNLSKRLEKKGIYSKW